MSDLISEDQDDEPNLSRLRYPKRIVLFLIVVFLLMGSAFGAGLFFQSPNNIALESSDTVLEVTAKVEERVVSAGSTVTGTIQTGNVQIINVTEVPASASSVDASDDIATQEKVDTSEIESSSSQNSSRSVVSLQTISIGDQVGYGTLLGEVSGRPLIAVPDSIPLYRNISMESQGNDVQGIQKMLISMGYLGVKETGRFDWGTFDAMRRLYAASGYTLPYISDGIQGVSLNELVPVVSAEATVLQAARVGTILTSEVPLAKLQTSPDIIVGRVSTAQIDSYVVGDRVNLLFGANAPLESTVTSIGPYKSESDGVSAGYDVAIQLPKLDEPFDRSIPISISSITEEIAGPAIPLVAIHQDNSGSYVELPNTNDDSSSRNRVYVVVLKQNKGWASIEENKDLPVGANIVVSG
ncbi:hypothetical protein GCM10022198_01990 [Klugiella xanthotipulae]|uniref:Peptidoglycan binding protein n=1 Tax=Klugiella xanthotipulae TaxID=244735 RepID=A0A543I502_9MICO|nr:peptidoglycan-binding domain-containing protein [Klugiella xanthotipulae]TQM65665.1 hypothetical protein FB466_0474 [Klugiella xanthotipulae]